MRHYTVRRIVAALFVALGVLTVGAGAAAAADDPGLTHNGTELTHN
jgi:hypothetical protein